MKSLKNIYLPIVLDTSSNNLVEDFYKPVLSNSITYDRGVGYFTSGWLRNNSIGLDQFIHNGGRARWITSPILSYEDWEAMILGDEAKKDKVLKEILLSSIDNLQENLEKHVLSALAWLVADNIIEFKLAVPRNNLSGEFHAKFGLFEDVHGNRIAFTGSNNDSFQGFLNFESLTVFKSWIIGHQEIVEQHGINFNRLWQNKDANVAVYELPDAAKEKILKLRSQKRNYDIEKHNKLVRNGMVEEIFKKLNLREYQQKAVLAWINNEYRGIIEMATGTGKTRVAVACLLMALHTKKVNIVIISCPQHTILEQWINDINKYQIPFEAQVIADSTNRNWKQDLQNILLSLRIGTKNHIVVYTLHPTSKSDYFRNTIKELGINKDILFIGDEVHSLGASKAKKSLEGCYEFRLGLSATPRRWYDEAGTKFVYEYFDDIVFEFSIKDGISTFDPNTGKSYLVPYYFYPIPVNLTEDELIEYYEFTKNISRLTYTETNEEVEKLVDLLRIHRANIHKNACNKIPELRKLLYNLEDRSGTLLFVSNEQQIEDCQNVLDELEISYHNFTENEGTKPQDEYGGLSERGFLIKKFSEKEIDVLIAIKCLDEGVNIPSARIALLLASSTNPREYIQRIGRVIRPATNKTFAYIYDFIIVPAESYFDDKLEAIEHRLFQKEMIRVSELAENAINNAEALIALQVFKGK